MIIASHLGLEGEGPKVGKQLQSLTLVGMLVLNERALKCKPHQHIQNWVQVLCTTILYFDPKMEQVLDALSCSFLSKTSDLGSNTLFLDTNASFHPSE